MSITTEFADGVATISLARGAKKNALTHAMYEQLVVALQEANADDAVRVIVLTSAEADFTAGNDLSDFANVQKPEDLEPVLDFLRALNQVRKPFIAGVSGKAVGIGTTLLLHCDFVYATEDSLFQMPFTALGICAEAGSSYLLPRLVGHQRASEYLLLGRPFDAHKAESLGLVNAVCSDRAALSVQIAKTAGQLCRLPQQALLATKALLKQDEEQVASCIEREARVVGHLLQSPESQKIIRSWIKERA